MSKIKPTDSRASPPGEGERRAQRGYVPQYDLAARVIYTELAAGRLKWIGVADRGAGSFDDSVLGLHDRIVAYQVKTSRVAEPFNIKTVLLGAENLWGRMVESRRKLQAIHGDVPIGTVYACDDYPRTDDNVGATDRPVSSSAFLRAHEEYRLNWSLADWRASSFGDLIAQLQAKSGLGDSEFESAWRHTRFLVRGGGRSLEAGERSARDDHRIGELAALLPRLVADPADKDRWSVAELLARLSWRDPFRLRHGHSFPVDGLYQLNAPTNAALQAILSNITSGYVSLVGPPGSGKSTLLAAGLLPTARAVVIRYLAFVPNDGQGLGRAEASHFLHDLVTQLKQQNLGVRLMPGTEVGELSEQFETLLTEASRRFKEEGTRTVVVVDGLDHVPREERPARSFLSELPLPQALPDGVILVLGTQHLNLADIPPLVVEQARQADRCVVVTPLPRETIYRLADMAGVPNDVSRDELFAHTSGHPLSTRYAVEALLGTATAEARRDWLRDGPAYGGDVAVFYERAWRDLAGKTDAQRALGYVALADGPIRPVTLDGLVGSQATDDAWRAARHLLLRDQDNAWSIFHNSFRLFVRARTGLRHDIADEAGVRRRYAELAEIVRGAGPGDPQRWMELRYRARAGDHAAVAIMASPDRFRSQFIEGRDPAEIRKDIGLAFAAAAALRRPELVVSLMLSRHEISMRCEALGDAFFETLLQLGERRRALGLVNAEGVTLAPSKGYELVDAFLAEGEAEDARKLFEHLEPMGKLLGSETLEPRAADNDVLVEWAERALVFRDAGQMLASLERLRAPDERFGREFNIQEYRTHLKLVAARGQLTRNSDLGADDVLGALQIGSEHRGLLLHLAVRSALWAGKPGLAAGSLEHLVGLKDRIGPTLRRKSASMAVQIERLDLAASFAEGIPAPTLAEKDFAIGDDFRLATTEIIAHAALVAQLGRAFVAGTAPASPLLAAYQRRIETLGRLLGEARASRSPSVEPVQELRETLEFLQRAEGDARNYERWDLDKAMDLVMTKMIEAAAAFGSVFLVRFAEVVDARLAGDPGRLGRSAVRRAYARAMFRHDQDPDRAVERLGYRPGMESTPGKQIEEAARAASALSDFGLDERARATLAQMHEGGLGYSRPAKKDPQYAVWRDLFVRACDDDPAGRPERLRFLGRLLAGMAETEGDGAAGRIAPTFMNQAAQAGPGWANAAWDLVERARLADWPDLVKGVLTGVVTRRPELACAAAVIFGRMALPFSGDEDSSIYATLIGAVPYADLESLVRHAVDCLEADAHPARRILFLEEVVVASADRGFEFGADALARWRSELPAPRSGNSPEDPFFSVRTLDEIATVLQQTRQESSRWGAITAFQRIAPRSDYAATKALFDREEVLGADERAIEVMARMAMAAGRRGDAVSCLARLKKIADEKGGWGDGWREKPRLRYHRLNVMLTGEAARRGAFDAFVDDLANGREYMDHVIPDLVDVLDMLSPRPTWALTWTQLQDHLSQFREYRLGAAQEPPPPAPNQGTDEETLADVLFRAFDTTSVDLAHMARTAAIELARSPGGAAVSATLLRRLWTAGGYVALEAAQVAWECREVAPIRESVLMFLPEMFDSDDFAIRRIALALAREWGQAPTIKRVPLPAIYELELPRNSQSESFEPPSGESRTSSGLYTEDPYAWTWPPEDAFGLMVSASDIELANLRARAAQLMSRMGGAAAFGPDASERQRRCLDRLRLHSRYRKLLVSAAFRAAREVVGELAAAEAIDPNAIALILVHAAAFSGAVTTLPPSPRPRGVPAAELPDPHAQAGPDAWRAAVVNDVVRPTIEGHVVLAATAVHERRQFQEEWIVEQYFGPESKRTENDLRVQLGRLPRAVVADGMVLLYDGVAGGGVVHPEPDMSPSIDPYVVALCPRLAAQVGWRSDRHHAFTYLDAENRVAAQTIYWRDGGVLCRDHDQAVFRYGYAVVVRQDQFDLVRPHLAASHVATAWRANQKGGTRHREVNCLSREMTVVEEPKSG